MLKRSHLSVIIPLILSLLLLYGAATGKFHLSQQETAPVPPPEGRISCTQGGAKPLGLSLADFDADGQPPNTILIWEREPEPPREEGPSFTDPSDE
jgi:hypothetical protein